MGTDYYVNFRCGRCGRMEQINMEYVNGKAEQFDMNNMRHMQILKETLMDDDEGQTWTVIDGLIEERNMEDAMMMIEDYSCFGEETLLIFCEKCGLFMGTIEVSY